MKKAAVAFVFALVVLTISALADVDCSTVTVCTLQRDDGLCHPAVLFNVQQDQTVSGTFSACEESDCGGTCSKPQTFSFDFMKGVGGVFLTFEKEPPECTTFSTQWTVDDCDAACGNHHCVTPTCPMGAIGELQEIVVP